MLIVTVIISFFCFFTLTNSCLLSFTCWTNDGQTNVRPIEWWFDLHCYDVTVPGLESFFEWMNKRTNEGSKKRTNERKNEQTTNKRMNERMCIFLTAAPSYKKFIQLYFKHPGTPFSMGIFPFERPIATRRNSYVRTLSPRSSLEFLRKHWAIF